MGFKTAPQYHGYSAEEQLMFQPGPYSNKSTEGAGSGTPTGSGAQHAACAKVVDIKTALPVMLGANRLYHEEKRRPPWYITKDDPFVPKHM